MKKSYINVESLPRLESLQVVVVSVVDTNSCPVVKVRLAGAVVLIVAFLMDVRVRVAVQDGHGHVVDNGGAGAGVAVDAVVGQPASRLEQPVVASGLVGLKWAQVVSVDEGDQLALVQARIFAAAPNFNKSISQKFNHRYPKPHFTTVSLRLKSKDD